MRRFRLDLACPYCNATSAVTVDWNNTKQRFRCGDCLMDRVEIVEMRVIDMTEVEDVRLV